MTRRPAQLVGAIRGPGRGRAFTFIELVVVIVILAILTGAIIPKLVGWKSRQSEQSVQAVANLLTAAAKHDTFSTNRAAVDYDAKDGRFKLMTLRLNDVSSFDPGGEMWMEDPLAPMATMEGIHLVAGASGAFDLDLKKFRVEFPGAGGAQGRPGLALVFADDSGSRWMVRLPPTATRAEVSPTLFSRGSLSTGDTDAIDLDATGGRDDPW